VAASAQAPSPKSKQPAGKKFVPFRGSHAFRRILHSFELEPVAALADLVQLPPAETLIVVFGDNAVLQEIGERTGGLDRFKNAGGAILIASDRDDQGRLRDWNLRITGQRVTEDFTSAYKHIVNCPMIEPPINQGNPLFKDVSRGIATNSPSLIHSPAGLFEPLQSDLQLLAGFSKDCTIAKVFHVGGAAYIVGTAGDERALVMAGHGVFMNGMMGQFDNDNLTFAHNCVRWLSETPGGKRKYALFVEEGEVVRKFDVELWVFPLPPLRVLNGLLRGIEADNIHNRFVQSLITRQQFWQGLLLLLSVMLVVYGMRRLWQARHGIEAGVPLVAMKTLAAPAAAPLTLQRQQALLAGGNFWEAGRELARFFLAELAGLPPRRPAGLPPFRVHGSPWRRWLVGRRLKRVWQLAHDVPRSFSARALRRLPLTLDALAQDFREGRLNWLE
jgi:hypothetical protein